MKLTCIGTGRLFFLAYLYLFFKIIKRYLIILMMFIVLVSDFPTIFKFVPVGFFALVCLFHAYLSFAVYWRFSNLLIFQCCIDFLLLFQLSLVIYSLVFLVILFASIQCLVFLCFVIKNHGFMFLQDQFIFENLNYNNDT